MLIDTFGRVVKSLRISVTDRCNFRCRYCMPEKGMKWMDKDKLLSYEEITEITSIFSGMGIDNVKITGGEPLVRKDLHLLIKMLNGINNLNDISLTTNGYFLEEHAEDLYDAGLARINVSLDSLDTQKFHEITKRNCYRQVIRGLECAAGAGFSPIKINVVLMKGTNDDEIMDFVYFARMTSFQVRFIEFMPIGADDQWKNSSVIPSSRVRQKIESELGLKLLPVDQRGSDPASSFVFEDGIGGIGFISSVSEPFCSACDRVRLTADGKLRTCLFSTDETDLRTALRSGSGRQKIIRIINDAVRNKEPGHLINRAGFSRPERTMSQIGG